ncbi:MAG TPA: FAD-dependent oxidoreductase [Bryobacteraceae bacterium]|nr:FAD-dependent oxidoreductase [Bryobacteraceae bacterium]
MSWLLRRDLFRTAFGVLAGTAKPSPAQEGGPAAVPAASEPVAAARSFDLVVVGGGIAGISCAISAARNGVRVALVHNRPMLGGNSSSEVRLYPEDNSRYHCWIREGGLNDEFHVEERKRNHVTAGDGYLNCHWDLVLYEWALREANLSLFLNTHMARVRKRGANRIEAIEAFQLDTEKEFVFSAPLFVDATGDGVLAAKAGADFHWGRDPKSRYGEPLAPDEAQPPTMGNTLYYRAYDTGRPVPFAPLPWARQFGSLDELNGRYMDPEVGQWWMEVGLPFHQIGDNDKIRHELLRTILGAWDALKNRGGGRADNYGLEFVGFVPYKRECRRILGDYVVTQQDVQDPRPLPDAVAYGCWEIDVHSPGGVLALERPPDLIPMDDWDRLGTQVYPIPLRSLYSRTTENLLMCGRPISCSYVAFSSSRVLRTGSIVGQAAGAAAAVCKRHGELPREAARKHATEVQQLILRDDGHVPGVANEDRLDLARQAMATASSAMPLLFPEGDKRFDLAIPHAQILPVSADRIDAVELLLENPGLTPARVALSLRQVDHVWDFRPSEKLRSTGAIVPPGRSWVRFALGVPVTPSRLYAVELGAAPGVFWLGARDEEGRASMTPAGVTPASLPGRSRWRPLTLGCSLGVRLSPASQPYGAENVNSGTNRPDRWTNIWISDPRHALPAWLELKWERPQSLNLVQLTFDTDSNRRSTLPLFRYPDCVRDYRLELDGRTVASVEGNYQRRRVHRFPEVQGTRLRLTVDATNGASMARVFEVRVYRETAGHERGDVRF